jgi:polyhydroxyalkanoate synthesis regulator phasin
MYEERLQAIETILNELQIQVNNLATKSDLTASVNVRQSEITVLTSKLDSLKTQVELLQALKILEEQA